MVATFVGRVNTACHDGDIEDIIYKPYDTSTAHFHVDGRREMRAELPGEETRDDPKPIAGKLLVAKYGIVDASRVWPDHYIGPSSSR
eukprot:4229692-Pyramimonas_sp.AAC.1